MTAVIETAVILDALAAAGELVAVHGVVPARFTDLTDDSRRVTPGALFVARAGSDADGHRFLPDAAGAGAAAAIVERLPDERLPALLVRHGGRAARLAAEAAFGRPAAQLAIAGVTGTNGKTTSVGMLRVLFDAPDEPAASSGTLGVLVGAAGVPLPGGAGLTTPGAIELQRMLRALVDRGVRRVAMEVSSHSLDQRRIDGLTLDAALFTNVSRDHLDYHGTMDAYVAAKARLLEHLSPEGVAVVNADEPAWGALAPRARVIRFGLSSGADVSAADVRVTAHGSEWRLRVPDESARIRLPLPGAFNVANALGAAAVAWARGVPFARIVERLDAMPQVTGRLERLLDRPVVLRDYAHTPDALERALDAVRPGAAGRLIVVFGCGGDRDRGKRPLMGAVAERRADHVILTSDNPRTEDPERILDDVEAGMREGRHERIEDRRAAIARAMALAREGDVVLLAGKGHETYQIRGTTSYPFDEAVIVRELAAGPAAEAAR